MSSVPQLNPAQRAAVEHGSGPVLVVAGAGSGKTRVLTARVARLLERGVPPGAVVAFTFTNRAAREMRERIARAVPESAERLWIGTFHGTGLRILRREAGRAAGAWWPPDFSIYDREDQESVLRDVVRRLELPDGSFRVSELVALISDSKNALVTPEQATGAAVGPHERRVAECYRLYQETLRRDAALDFDDLIAEAVRLLQQPEVVERYAGRFQHVLVDEYQDTNHAQFRLVTSLASRHGNVFVVGDDDQSIYGWRGADLAHVLDFERTFPGATVVRLEQNYRSTANILRAANAVIAHNRERQGKRLWCEREDGPRLKFVLAADEVDEARRICGYLEERRRRHADARLSDCAVLYRTNAQSRALETELRHRGLPYEVVGGVAFYQRREVKDVLAYLRLVGNPADQAAFWRVVNTPRRGLGDAVRARIEQRLAGGAADPVEALRALRQEGELGRAAAGGTAFLEVIDNLRLHATEPVDLLVRRCLERSGYLKALEEDRAAGEAADRRANLEELIASAAQFAAADRESGLAAFLGEAALLADVDRLAEDADRVLLLTAHNAKGLEFPVVVIAGLEEGLLPHGSALESAKELEEERRLFYVALTRARDEVLLTAAALRRRFATGAGAAAQGGQVSRFVEEIPEEVLDREEPLPALLGSTRPTRSWGSRRSGSDRPGGEDRSGPAYRTPTSLAHTLGREVFHESFGRGVVIAAEGGGSDLKFTVRFGPRVRKVLGRFLTGGSDVH